MKNISILFPNELPNKIGYTLIVDSLLLKLRINISKIVLCKAAPNPATFDKPPIKDNNIKPPISFG